VSASTPSTLPISLRDVCEQDQTFLYEVYASTRADELALVPWNEEQRGAFLRMQFTAQDNYYREQYAKAEYKVILFERELAGRLYVLREEKSIRILDITVIPTLRNRGIGTVLLREILDEARDLEKTVQIYVETYNRSLRLFERLGFERKAEEGINFLLEWRRT
jgi:ribosomal protein S18 acetylase RimI-like enzyme